MGSTVSESSKSAMASLPAAQVHLGEGAVVDRLKKSGNQFNGEGVLRNGFVLFFLAEVIGPLVMILREANELIDLVRLHDVFAVARQIIVGHGGIAEQYRILKSSAVDGDMQHDQLQIGQVRGRGFMVERLKNHHMVGVKLGIKPQEFGEYGKDLVARVKDVAGSEWGWDFLALQNGFEELDQCQI